jgi:anti-anti-sigma factor
MGKPAIVRHPHDEPLFHAALELSGQTARVVVIGELDVACTDALRSMLDEAIAAGVGEVRLDLAGLRFCDAAGIGEFVRARAELLRRHRSLILERVPCGIQRTVRLAEADLLLT